jgi:uncharacterized protein YfaS (alpha-2-macroglobulin family)
VDGVNEALNTANTEYEAAMRAGVDFMNHLPSSTRNAQLTASINTQMYQAAQRSDRIIEEQQRAKGGVTKSARVTVADYRSEVNAQYNFWSRAQRLYCTAVPDDANLLRRAGAIFRQLLGADLLGSAR